MRSKQFVILAVASLLFLAADVAPGEARLKLYVLHSRADDMSVIDVATNQVLKTVKVGLHPHGIAAPLAQDVLYVATEGDNSLAVINPVTDKVIAIYPIFGRRPNEIEVTLNGRYVYVPALGDGVYEVFDTRTSEIVARIPTDGFPHNVVISPDGQRMYLSPYDRGEMSVEKAKEQGLPTSLNKKIYVVDANTHKVIATIPTPNTPRPIAISPDGKRLYVNTDNFLGFLVVDLIKRKVIYEVPYELTEEEKAIRSRSHGIGVTPDGKEVWSTSTSHGVVHVFDVTQEPPKQIARVQVGKIPYWVTFTPDGGTVYIANTGDDTVSAIDAATKTERARIRLREGTGPKRMLVLKVPEPEPNH